MALSPRLELRQGQGLVITPQLQQAIKLLQLSNLELEAFVEGELERNPLLQREDREDGAGEAEAPAAEADSVVEHDFGADRVTDSAAAADIDARHDDLYDGASPGDLATGDAGPGGGADAGGSVDWSKAGRGGGGFEDGDGEREGGGVRELSLAEHLDAQVAVAGLTDAERAIAMVLIDAVDDGGYLRADLVEIAERLGCDLARIEAVLAALAGLRAHRRLRARRRRVPDAAAEGEEPLRPGDGGPGRQPRAAGAARHGGLEAGLRASTTKT